MNHEPHFAYFPDKSEIERLDDMEFDEAHRIESRIQEHQIDESLMRGNYLRTAN